jgi:beta-glucosidase
VTGGTIENSRFFVNVQADDRTMHEVYLSHFRKIVQAGVASVMGSYNRFMGVNSKYFSIEG